MGQLTQEENSVCILLGVWGEKFIIDFLEFSLPSLLAPGNIPALAKTYKTKFVFLTRSYDVSVFQEQPIFQKLESVCEIEFISINDLIVVGNYSTTLTLAYDRAIRATGEQMLKTYFIFLTSDYIMADGSLEGLMRYIKKGYSGICAGNFQVLEEEMLPFLQSNMNPDTQVMAINSRTLLKESFQHLHPIAVTSIFRESKVHNYRANRFFLRYNEDIMVGRFYLLHMLCIKPETMDYQVGASCDYSFIPEMCPSGNIGIINDSDDYLVVEIQSREHEINYVKWGPYNHKKLVHALAEWTTHQHRANAQNSIYYHAIDITPEMKITIENTLNEFVGSLTNNLQKFKPQPYRNHPYWLGAVSAFNQHKSIIKNSQDYDYFDLSSLNYASKSRKLFHYFFGYPPTVYRWHYRWREYASVMDTFKKYITNCDKTFILYHSYQISFMRYSKWFKNALKIQHHYHSQNLLYSKTIWQNLKARQFELCVILVRLEDLRNIKSILRAVKKVLADNGKVLLFMPNQKNFTPGFLYDFRKEFACRINHLMNSPFNISDVLTIHDNFSFLGTLAVESITTNFDYSRKIKFLLYFFLGIPGSLLCFIRNFFSKASSRKKGHCTNMLITLTPNENSVEAT